MSVKSAFERFIELEMNPEEKAEAQDYCESLKNYREDIRALRSAKRWDAARKLEKDQESRIWKRKILRHSERLEDKS